MVSVVVRAKLSNIRSYRGRRREKRKEQKQRLSKGIIAFQDIRFAHACTSDNVTHTPMTEDWYTNLHGWRPFARLTFVCNINHLPDCHNPLFLQRGTCRSAINTPFHLQFPLLWYQLLQTIKYSAKIQTQVGNSTPDYSTTGLLLYWISTTVNRGIFTLEKFDDYFSLSMLVATKSNMTNWVINHNK